jgi:hypothetical protein
MFFGLLFRDNKFLDYLPFYVSVVVAQRVYSAVERLKQNAHPGSKQKNI